MPDSSRRDFLKTSAAVTAATTLAAPAFASSRNVNDKFRVVVVGMGGRAKSHVASILELEQEGALGVELVGVCDCDQTKLEDAKKLVKQLSGKEIPTYDDFRKVLDDDSVDAICLATPNHWHSLGVIWGCQAGKDVYVEKPGSQNIFEGRQMVEAARKYDRIVQHGTQCRSSANIMEGIQKLHDGIIGDVYFARGVAYKIRGDLGQHAPRPVPEGLDWDAWCGPAPVNEFSNFQHKRWHWLWDYGNGEIGNQGVHQFDVLRWGLNRDTHPTTISSMGTNYMQEEVHNSSAETPGVQTATFKWPDGLFIEMEVRDWYTNAEAGFRDEYPFVQKDFPVGAIFLGTEGTMIFPDYSSYRTFLGRDRKEGPFAFEEGSPISNTAHFRNWVEACRSRRREDLNAEIFEGHMSSSLCHLANIAYRVDHTVQFDPETETFKDDDAANALLSRPEREPFIVPKQV
ncbi:Alpha-N-acetylgalactosaminidase [Planctomycetales bacterium 10988]|nr:Alpha-N-acetylgalactosaminidase [Planctomycetales bacterium 10988]